MAKAERSPSEVTVILDREGLAKVMGELAQAIVEALPDMDSVVLMGILSRGRPIADRLALRIQDLTGQAPRVGSLATTLYRDDLRSGRGIAKAGGGETHFDFSVDGLTVVLVDDVIHKARTVRAAMDDLMDYGRPARVQLAALVDRGGRELPIQPDYRGCVIGGFEEDHVRVLLDEIDDRDAVEVEHAAPKPRTMKE